MRPPPDPQTELSPADADLPVGAAGPRGELRWTAAPAGDGRMVGRLAQQFVHEPELILACLEAQDEQSSDLGTILAAASNALAEFPQYADLHYFAAHAAIRAGHLRDARSLLARALELNPGYNDALILAARVCMAQGQQDVAIAHLRQALVNGADYADVYLMLGDLWRERDDVLQARQAYGRALDINADLLAAQAGLAALKAAVQEGGADELPA